jgi:hypothetical protein
MIMAKLSLLLLTLCIFVVGTNAQRPLNIQRESSPSVSGLLWKTRKIPVCWLNPESDVRGQKEIVIKAIRDSWSRFIGSEFQWVNKCKPLSQVTMPEIRILINPEPDRSYSSIGTYSWVNVNGNWTFPETSRKTVAGLSGPEWDTHTMYLSLGHYYTGVSELKGLRFTAIHEFGHALGFLHEQTADNVPQSCIERLPSLGSSVDERKIYDDAYGSYGIIYTNYDADSIMNYCRPDLLKDQLSAQDIVSVQSIYPRTEQTVTNASEYFSISDSSQERCLTTVGLSMVQMNDCSTADDNQLWIFVENADHSFIISPKTNPNKSLTVGVEALEKLVSGELKTKYEEIVTLLGVHQGTASDWFRTPTGKDGFILQLSLSGFVLDRDTWDDNRRKVILYKNWRGSNQVWKITKVSTDLKAPNRK